MKRIKVILAHANYEKSIANKTIINRLSEHFPTLEVRNIAELYPDFNINVVAEQENLSDADIVLFQFPIYWYNIPAILKQWMDQVLAYGFAYGDGGDKLENKVMLLSATAGSPKDAYTPIGHNHFYLHELLNNIQSTAYFCRMEYSEPILGYNYIYIPDMYNTKEAVENSANDQADRLIERLEKLLSE